MTGSFWNIGNKKYMFPTVKSALLLLLDLHKGWALCHAWIFLLWVSLCIIFLERFSIARIFSFGFATPTITFLMVRCLFFRSSPISYPESPGFFANDTLTCTLEVRKDFIAFCERSFKRTIADILRRNSSNAFFFRSAALGKSCVLHIEYFKESAWLTYDRVAEVWKLSLPGVPWFFEFELELESAWLRYLIRPSCWDVSGSFPGSFASARVYTRSMVINLRILGHLFASLLWMRSMLIVIPRSALKRKWSCQIFFR